MKKRREEEERQSEELTPTNNRAIVTILTKHNSNISTFDILRVEKDCALIAFGSIWQLKSTERN